MKKNSQRGGAVIGLLVAALLAQLLGLAGNAAASCRIANETPFSFTVASGNVANQRVNAQSTTTIAPGKIQGKSDDGKTISGTCKDGGDLVITQKNGVPLLGPKKAAPPKKKSGKQKGPLVFHSARSRA